MEEALVQAAGEPKRDTAKAPQAVLEPVVAALPGEVRLDPPSQSRRNFETAVIVKRLDDPIGETLPIRPFADELGGTLAQSFPIHLRDERFAIEREFPSGRVPMT
jgi:hypothetical protein